MGNVKLQLTVLDVYNRVLGPEHPCTLTSMASLAVTYSNHGKYEEAGELKLKVQDSPQKMLGLEHPYTLTSMTVKTYSKQEKYGKAEKLEMEMSNSALLENLANSREIHRW